MTTLTSPTSISSDLIPTIVNLEEAREMCHQFGSVITAGPSLREVLDFAHPDHKVVEFDDVTSHHFGYVPPTFDQVEEMVRWGEGRTNLLVHCHAGMSRSTATAWGIAIANGFDAQEAFDLLKGNHPVQTHYVQRGGKQVMELRDPRPFIPNRLIVKHLETLFNMKPGTLRRILDNAN
ncbi:MAG: Dual specificity phosphatase, catalytic domain [Actinomycetota bacterium]|jgi:predicted protein tyrosine phosphatase